MRTKFYWCITLLTLLPFYKSFCQNSAKNAHTGFVDPFIGTLGAGNTFPGACLPHGFVKLGPDNLFNSGAAGYKKNKDVTGFSHLHISGMGGPLYGNIQLMPVTGYVMPLHHISPVSHEKASPGYYQGTLDKYHIIAELTATAHTGFHRYTFPESSSSHVLLDAGATLYGVDSGWYSSMPVDGEVHIDPARKAVYGYHTYKGGRSTTKPWTVFFYAVFDTPFKSYATWQDSIIIDGKTSARGKWIGASLSFATANEQKIQVKVGLSMLSTDKAKMSIEQELPSWDFDKVKDNAEHAWENELKKIEIKGVSNEQNRIFYSALYHALLAPSDWTGENPKFDYHRPYYEDYLCIWDIFRTVSPLLTLISTHEQRDMLNSLLDVYKTDGWLPDGHSALQREHIQVGTNADVLFADAFLKKIKGIDYRLAYQAMKKDAEDTSFVNGTVPHAGRIGLPSYKQYHYVTSDAKFGGRRMTVSRTLEYVYDDFCLYEMAKGLHYSGEAYRYKSRGYWYKNLWDDSLKLMRGRFSDGRWIKPFDPAKSETGANFYEGHAYTWTYTAPHDVKGLIGLFGGRKPFVDSLTYAVSNHYQAWNEPCMLEIYLFVWAGRPDLTQKFVRQAARESFFSSYNGLPGNDDSGTTSAWYLWSQIGIFPVAGQNLYIIGSPAHPKTIIHLESGKDLVIDARNASTQNVYIQSARLNGKPYNKAFFTHDQIMNGATFEFIMGPKASAWGRLQSPPSLSDKK